MNELQVGDKAPEFSTTNQRGDAVTLSNYRGKKLILYFYPKDNTPGCTKQACNLRDNFQVLKQQGFELLGVSPDTAESHQKFIEKFDLPFDLLVDTNNEIATAYQVWVEKNMYGRKFFGIARTTFVIDDNSVIKDIVRKVKTDDHANQLFN